MSNHFQESRIKTMDLSRLNTLKTQIVEAKQFDKPFNYFFDHFGEVREFIHVGERTQSPLLDEVLKRLGENLYGEGAPYVPGILTEIKEYHFIHGNCFLAGRLAVLIFFTDLDMGLLSVAEPGKGALMMRFTSYLVEQDQAGRIIAHTGTDVQ
jgi:hypothetical protein